jgi:hypothetical protein
MARRISPLIAVSLFLFGCTTYTEKYAQYEGQQKNWPVSTGVTVDTQEAVPVYYGPPPRPYIVMGDLTAGSADGNTLSELAASAKSRGADAIVLLDSKMVNVGSHTVSSGYVWGGSGYAFGTGTSSSVPVNATLVDAILIKWK